MEIKYSDYCYSNRFEIDGKNVEDFSEEEKLDIIQKIALKYGLDDVLKNLVDSFGNQEFDDDPCYQCGHYSTETTLEL